jgi:hypothetical protein
MSDELLKNEGDGEDVEGHKHVKLRNESEPSEDADAGDEVEAHKHVRLGSDDDSDFELHRHKA